MMVYFSTGQAKTEGDYNQPNLMGKTSPSPREKLSKMMMMMIIITIIINRKVDSS